jgi:hypothetical protein
MIYDAWLFVRIVEEHLPNSENDMPLNGEMLVLMSQKRFKHLEEAEAFRRSIKVGMYAMAEGYVEKYPKRRNNKHTEIGVTGKGFIFSTRLGLIDKYARTFGWILQFTSIVIAIGALLVSFYKP